ncbi:hypothetical protein QN224_13055 [Sinorhizobium sp. 8-89]|uniref:hypothetical protein n=1 Tax=Sinorhizobium sp. 7-81 TaxID=3049087 RepID=UPI0024C2C62A|nr:hypothetical protein [Sinorhizobium sp. 7-81]MDK1386337.1 hypothetical protein [Sinorhizobium sp. 7-81]
MTKKLPKKAKAAVKAIATSDDAIFGSVRKETEAPLPPLSLHNNPIVLFLGGAVLVGGLLLIFIVTAAAEQARAFERLATTGRLDAAAAFDMERFQ